MGKTDAIMFKYMSDRERIADLFNGVYFQGRQMIQAENIEDYEEKYPVKKETHRTGHRHSVRYRDIIKKLKNGGSLRILAIENQNLVDYTMPFRCMEYDTLEYRRQIDHRIRENAAAAKWNNDAEFLCGIHKEDRFAPIYTICLYHGKRAWDGPRTLRDMMDFGTDEDPMSKYFTDYPMKLFCVNEEKDFNCFRTELKEFFTVISCQEDRERLKELTQKDDIKNISRETAETIAVVLGWPDPKRISMKYEEEGKGVDMCRALRELLAEEWEKGEKRGIEQGIEQNTYSFILSMHEENIELDKICRICGKTEEEVRQILERESQ